MSDQPDNRKIPQGGSGTSQPFSEKPRNEQLGYLKNLLGEIRVLQHNARIANAFTMRRDALETNQNKRNINEECDYPDVRSYSAFDYKNLYDSEAIAARVVEVLPRESWQVQPSVFEDDDASTYTQFEKDWDNLGTYLRGEMSWHRNDEGGPVWEHLQRADEQSGIGHYGVILLGFNDILLRDSNTPNDSVNQGTTYQGSTEYDSLRPGSANSLADPVEGVIERMSPDWETVKGDIQSRTKGRKLLFMRTFPESQARVTRWDSNQGSPRYGQPIEYLVTMNDPQDSQQGGIGLTTGSHAVHWTRIIHIADNLGSSEVIGVPRMRPVLRRLMDLQKEYGSAGEGYWQSCFSLLSFETHPQLGGDVAIDMDAIRDTLEQIRNGLQRDIETSGMHVNPLTPSVVDPSPFIKVAIEAICIKLAIPIRIFMGSERGELASTQDDDAWNDRIKQRQKGHITPRIVIPFVNRLIAVGCLAEPINGYGVEWPDITSSSADQKASVCLKKVQALAVYVESGLESVLSFSDFLVLWMGETEETAASIISKTRGDALGEQQTPEPPIDLAPADPSLDKGITSGDTP